jgi:hypothetical protein
MVSAAILCNVVTLPLHPNDVYKRYNNGSGGGVDQSLAYTAERTTKIKNKKA